ncbi:RNA polymerase sigma-70 factor [Nocardia otitidiscaviarum]|uniref:RNA polymerase sigma-70 factor n=1 Tax=Nocardia otitidiscaviarum TaxID=1823 RepID=UPI001FD42CD5|nr:RNA polymerase sigma-70 factor [Nocardia otitidiscaviarum]MCP9619377.1 RNA polymerase sigma-70 factor [Nocardia otitidiscaviarum]
MTTGDEEFAELRPLLFTIAYEILGSAADAEDIVQDSYLRWRDVDAATVAHPRRYLVQTVTRQSLNHLRTVRRRREDYIGSWLPEPIRTGPDASADTVLAESVSMAMLLILETLGPTERAVFVLAEVFGYSQVEIADMVGKSDVTVRQILHRARRHVQARRQRFQLDDTAPKVIGQFLRAAKTGDIAALLDLMAPDVVQISDGGGRVRVASRPIAGAERVAAFCSGLARRQMAAMTAEFGTYNALPAVLFHAEGVLDSILLFEIADGRVTRLYAVRNPEKLRAARTLQPLTLGRETHGNDHG